MPTAMNMYPSWLIVEYASTRLMSNWAIAHVAANNAVTTPTTSTTVSATPEISKSTCERTTRYTPAVTIVAAWISADTGVGPAIASGNQTCKGSCADFPIAPAKSSSAITVAASFVSIDPAVPKITSKSSVPNLNTSSVDPTSISVSPIRVVMNAFFAASALPGTVYQNPINR